MTNARSNMSATRHGRRGARAARGAFSVASLFILLAASFPEVALAQRRTPRRPTRRAAQPSIDYSKFSHATEKHKQACNTCHKAPTKNWQKAGSFPDVADYPDHDACVSCHRRQFFRGARPPICTVCHTKVSPRDDARFAFRDPAALRQFTIEFPHDKHQDVIARTWKDGEARALVEFRAVAFAVETGAQDDKTKTYNNCAICHAPGATNPLPPAGGWIDSFSPDAATFKAVPTSHSSCFNCHWKSQAPVSSDCKGCHKLTTRYRAIASPMRISIKFRHAREQHVAECTTCHINITKASSLRGLKPDVPITSCTECHNKDGLRLDVSKELQAIDKNPAFVCVYCHTSDVGRLDPAPSHYVIAGREPIKRSSIK